MTFPVVGSNIPGAYQISNSLRFNDDDSARLTKTFSAGNRDLFTWSGWVKRGNLSANMNLFREDNTFNLLRFNSSNQLEYFNNIDSATIVTNALYRDVSAWYNIQFIYDSGNATASDRLQFYVNGERITSFSSSSYPSLNADSGFNSAVTHSIGARPAGTEPFDGYLAEVHFIDGQALSPTDFGEFDEDSGVWKPKQYAGTYGTNGFYLKFNNTGNMGEDSSGNDNTWTPTNLSGTADVMIDTPTNNFSTWNPVAKTGSVMTFSEGNLKVVTPTTLNGFCISTIAIPSTGKWYWEVNALDTNTYTGISVYNPTATHPYSTNNSVLYLSNNGNKYIDGTAGTAYGATYGAGDIIGIACDADADTITFYKNNVSQGAISHTMTDMFPTLADSGSSTVSIMTNFGQDSSFAGNKTRQNNTDGNGYGDFYYTPPSGYLALCTQNLATVLSPTIDDGSLYQNQVLYTGNSGTQSITGVGFQPDLVWIKARNQTYSHRLIDSTRGVDKGLRSNDTSAETTVSGALTSFDSDGFSLGFGTSETNNSAGNYVAWNWKANGGTTSSNTDGSITSTVQANTTAGFSIITYTGTGASGSVGHGLTKAPEMVICKQRTDAGTAWQTGHTGLTSWNYKLLLNDTSAENLNANVFPSAPTSTVINLGLAGDSNGSGKSQLIYAFHSVEGYSKFGSYTGNGSADGTFVYTGFRPAFVIIKRTDTAKNWYMFDTVRNTYNVIDDLLAPNLSDAETSGTGTYLDILSNGFKLRQDFSHTNASGSTQIYMAFAENPFVTSGAVPVTAR